MRYNRLLDQVVRRVHGPGAHTERAAAGASAEVIESLIEREWLVSNGMGGYSSSSLAMVMTRRYHGLLVAALPNPMGRMLMMNRLEERVTLRDGTVVRLDGEERLGSGLEAQGPSHLHEFVLVAGLPVWRYAIGDAMLERRVMLAHEQNTVYVRYRLYDAREPITIELRPAVHFRGYEDSVDTPLDRIYRVSAIGTRYELAGADGLPPLRFFVEGSGVEFALHGERIDEVFYRMERFRGYASAGSLWSPGHFSVPLEPGGSIAFVASTEHADVMQVLDSEQALRLELERRRRLIATAFSVATSARAERATESPMRTLKDDVGPAELVLAADQFIITPVGRHRDAAIARAVGDEVRTVIAGYHWFTDWGRDTMISLEGLTLTSGRHQEAGFILRTFARYVRDGLIPNMFPDGSNEGLYHTADATLWFFQAMQRYLRYTDDGDTLSLVLPTLRDIVRHHLRGTRYGIGVDASDGLLRQGQEGYQLTWMDAKVGDWVVTPRRGKAVEINALWYNALCLLEGWMRSRGATTDADEIAGHAARARHSFNERFWYEEGGYLYDVIDGEHGASAECRPNQLFAISLEHPVLDESRWESVVHVCRDRLLTPVGLRSLAPGSEHYAQAYDGDLRSRDAAYHQGTVWGWLIGPWVDAWLRVHPDDQAGARRFLDGMFEAMDRFGIGTVAEIFDAESPYTPRGCISQAWSVAETLRALMKTE